MLENNSRWVANWIEALLSLVHSLSICSEPKLRVFFLISKEYEKKLVIVLHGLGPCSGCCSKGKRT